MANLMTLAEIFVKLPPDIAPQLEKLLERAAVPNNPTREQVMEVAGMITNALQALVSEDDAKTLRLLELLPKAIADELFQ